MPGVNSQRIKTYVVIGLSVVLVIVAYFRFFYNKSQTEAKSSTPVESGPKLNLSNVEPKIKSRLQLNQEPYLESFQPIARDIFTPLITLKRAEIPQAKEKSTTSAISLQLRGTIIGGESPVAIINDQFIRMGDWIEGFQVVKIGKTEVLLDSGNSKIALELVRK